MWEALTAIGSIASAVVIAVTVVMAARQVKITADQLEQTRRAVQFEAVRSVLLEMADPKFVEAYRFVMHELPQLLQDEKFYRELGQVGIADDEVHKEIYLLRALDRVGAYVKYGLIDGPIVYDTYAPRILLSWESMTRIVAIHRQIASASLYQTAEFLYDDCARWSKKNGSHAEIMGAKQRMSDFMAGANPTPAAATNE
jgi:hypothetical protein